VEEHSFVGVQWLALTEFSRSF